MESLSPQDDRSPWLLFGDLSGVRRAVSAVFYRETLGRPEEYRPTPAAEVIAFIDAEHAETTYHPRYHGLYDARFIHPGDVDPVGGWAWDAERVRAWFADWPPADLEQRMKDYNRLQSESHLLNGLKSGAMSLKGRTFTLRDQQYTAADVRALVKQVDEELEAASKGIRQLDREAFLAHWSLARLLDAGGGNRAAELLERYHFHEAAQQFLQRLLNEEGRLRWVFETLSGRSQLDEGTFGQIQHALREVYDAMAESHRDARKIPVPALTNVPAGTRLYDLLAERSDGRLPDMPHDTISGEWINGLANRLGDMLQRVKRVHFKSLGGLLAFQEKLAAEPRPNPPTSGE